MMHHGSAIIITLSFHCSHEIHTDRIAEPLLLPFLHCINEVMHHHRHTEKNRIQKQKYAGGTRYKQYILHLFFMMRSVCVCVYVFKASTLLSKLKFNAPFLSTQTYYRKKLQHLKQLGLLNQTRVVPRTPRCMAKNTLDQQTVLERISVQCCRQFKKSCGNLGIAT